MEEQREETLRKLAAERERRERVRGDVEQLERQIDEWNREGLRNLLSGIIYKNTTCWTAGSLFAKSVFGGNWRDFFVIAGGPLAIAGCRGVYDIYRYFIKR